MNDTTVVIKTIGRRTLRSAVNSAVREGFDPIIVSDGADIPPEQSGGCRVIRLGKNWGYYGGMTSNVGAAVTPTEFMTLLDDDDEFVEGAGDIIRSKLRERPEIDIWIGGVRFKDRISLRLPDGSVYQSTDLAVRPDFGVNPGNVAMPTYRTEIFSRFPFVDNVAKTQDNLTDFLHVRKCMLEGYKVYWYEKAIYLVRPDEQGTNGGGKL